MRFLPANLLAGPLVLTGAFLLVDLRVITNRVADGPWTVRLVAAAPSGWLGDSWGWGGLSMLAAGLLAALLGTALVKVRWGTAVRYGAFSSAAGVLALAGALSMWRSFNHITDFTAGGVQWRFLAVQRTHWANDVTTALLAVAALACFALSFGRRPASDVEDAAARQARRKRVPDKAAPSATTSNTMPAGVATQRRSPASTRPPGPGA